MLQDRSKRVAAANGRIERLALVTGRELAGTVIALVVLLSLVFPDKQLFEELLTRSTSDALSIAYLENLLDSDPDNPDWRLLLAGEQVGITPYAQLHALLQPIWQRGSQEQQKRARHIQLKAIAMAYQSGQTILSAAEIDRLLQQQLRESSTSAELIQLADNALLLKRNTMALSIYQQLSTTYPADYRKWLAAAAERSLGSGNYRLAADLYLMARRGAPISQARNYFHRGIGALMADNRYREAMQDAQTHLGNLSKDAETLRFLIRTARAADNNPQAASYARMLIELESER